MTQVELKDILLDRVGWEQSAGFDFTLTAEAKESDSGLFFQDAHPFIKLKTILDVQDKEDMNEAEFSTLLVKLKTQNALLAISDVFQVINIYDDVVTDRLNVFDNVLQTRMAISIGELILTSTRSNHTERITKQQTQQIFFEINGNTAGSQFNPDLPMYVGLKSKYGAAVRKLQDLLQQEKSLDTFTLRTLDFDDDDEFSHRYNWVLF